MFGMKILYMKTQHIFITLLIVLSFSCKKNEQKIVENKKTILKGCVIGRDSDTLLLVKSHEDVRSDVIASIPIKENEFEYAFEADEYGAYALIFQDEIRSGGWKPVRFYSERDTIKLTLYSFDEFDSNIIIGGDLNSEYKNYQATIKRDFYSQYNSVRKKYEKYDYKEFYSDAYKELITKLNQSKTQVERVPLYQKQKELQNEKLDKSDLGKIKDAEFKVINDALIEHRYAYIKNNPGIVSYSLIIDDILGIDYNQVPKEKVMIALNDLKQKFPDHSYTELGENLWIGFTEMKPGGNYINFSAPDIDGKIFELKSVVDANEVLLLDLWATWCGPCIARSRLMLPVYEKYKDNGFNILGVAGEHKNLDKYTAFMEKEQWPWKQLIELDKENRIWEKYNVMNGGGGMFLIDSSGEILAVDPSAEEVEAILNKKLVSNKIKA